MRNTRSGGAIGQGDMYHIFAPQGHRQDNAPLGKYHPPRTAATDPPRLVELLAAVFAGVGRVKQEMDLSRSRRGLDLVGAVDEVAGARLHAEAVEGILAQRQAGPLAEIGGDAELGRLERAPERGLELALGVGGIEFGPSDADPRPAAGR